MEELNLGPLNTNPFSGREEDLNQVPLDYKSSVTNRPRCLPLNVICVLMRQLDEMVGKEKASGYSDLA